MYFCPFFSFFLIRVHPCLSVANSFSHSYLGAWAVHWVRF
jgi:hypothetical protein